MASVILELPKPIDPPRGHNPAPARAADIINRTLTSSIDESLALELDAIVELGETESTRNLIRNFFLADKYRKGSSKAPNEKFTHAAVIGAGVMGSGIAQWLSARGISVILRDVNAEQLDRGLGNIEKTYGEAVKRGLMSEEKAKEGRARIVASSNPGPMREVQIVIEAASEKIEVKRAIFHDLDTQNRRHRHSRDQHFRALDQRSRRADQASRPRHRDAFFQPGQPDEIDRGRDRETDFRRNERARALLRPADRQDPGRGAGQPGISGQPRPLSLPPGGGGTVRAGRGGRGDRCRAPGVGDADGPAPFDRRDRGRHHGRHRGDFGKIVRRTRPHACDLTKDAGGKIARPQNRERLLQIRGESAVA